METECSKKTDMEVFKLKIVFLLMRLFTWRCRLLWMWHSVPNVRDLRFWKTGEGRKQGRNRNWKEGKEAVLKKEFRCPLPGIRLWNAENSSWRLFRVPLPAIPTFWEIPINELPSVSTNARDGRSSEAPLTTHPSSCARGTEGVKCLLGQMPCIVWRVTFNQREAKKEESAIYQLHESDSRLS